MEIDVISAKTQPLLSVCPSNTSLSALFPLGTTAEDWSQQNHFQSGSSHQKVFGSSTQSFCRDRVCTDHAVFSAASVVRCGGVRPQLCGREDGSAQRSVYAGPKAVSSPLTLSSIDPLSPLLLSVRPSCPQSA